MPCCRIAPFDLLARLEREGTEAQGHHSSAEQDAIAQAWSAVGVTT